MGCILESRTPTPTRAKVTVLAASMCTTTPSRQSRARNGLPNVEPLILSVAGAVA
jgi:hypothetical protein